ncbi:hmg-i hmg- dna-binding protein [Ophiostoma piceae UAMH 11346]|uniref:Hmg-i hmg-dna-binding protein n=1 Tax=Ophiostoma piceae (strain UAMH 11346) TaxID=1262450 RepID=S3C6G4_OPHP1|nr:hmg-i hmg- dna-binding protein [Ophiostoma piceae UAMH 11346]
MGKDWQLLGEVPDSDDDDDGLDSQDSLADIPVQQQDLFFGDLSDHDDDTVLPEAQAVPSPAYPAGKLGTDRPPQHILSVVLSPRLPSNPDATPAGLPASPPPRPGTPPPALTQESSSLSSLPAGFDDDDEIDLVDDGLPVEDDKQHSQPRSPAAADIHHDSSHGTEERQETAIEKETPTPMQSRPSSPILPPSQKSHTSHTSYTPQLVQRPHTAQTSQLPRPRTPQPSQTPRQTPQPEASENIADPFSFSPTSSLSSLSRSPSPMLPEPAPAAAPAPVPASTHASSGHRVSSPPFVFPVIPDSPQAFRLGFVRSLRPRKPIQQHPYLLENAQYAHAMKRHGMKPVRTEYNSATRKQPTTATEEDSQEQYSEQNTQLRAEQDVLSDPAFINDDLYDFPSSPPARGSGVDRPELPSLSPSTSTPAHRLLFPTSSQGGADVGTDDTSMAEEDDFPNPATYFQERRKRQLFGNRASSSKSSKRQATPPTSSAAKRARLLDAALQSGTHPSATTPARAKWIPVPFSSSPDPLPRPSGRMRVIRSSSPPIPSPPPPPQRESYMITDDMSEAESEAGEPAEEEAAAENDADTVRKNSRRIKGVLPASWLRLDQQKTARVSNDRVPPTQRRPGPQADSTPRRGVALPRQGASSTSFATLASIFDESDDENETTVSTNNSNNNKNDNSNNNDNDNAQSQRSRPRIAMADLWSEETDADDSFPVYHQIVNDEDIGSVMEADVIDRMEAGPSRSRTLNTGARSQPRHLTRNPSFASSLGSTPNQKTRQPKIDRMFDRTAASSIAHKSRKSLNKRPSGQAGGASAKPSSTSSKPRSSGHKSASGPSKSTRVRRPRAPSTPPLLSILDFVEPHSSAASGPQRMRQPDFIRVAARTARKSHTLGKASPSRKVINLGSRSDNVDALSVLQDWRANKIQPRIPNPPRLNQPRRRAAQSGSSGRSGRPAPHHSPLHEISANLPRQPSSLKEVVSTQPAISLARPESEVRPAATSSTQAAPKRPAKTQYVNSIQQPRLSAPRRSVSNTTSRPGQAGPAMRPAQLETAARSRKQGTAGFVAKKKALDEMYRQRRKEAAIRPSVHLEQFIDDQASNYGSVDAMEIDDFGADEARPVEEQPPVARSENTVSTKNTARPEVAERLRFRKRYNPQAVDTSAPRFVHALDPLPVNIGPATVDLEAETTAVEAESDKLRGLGPYGSQYSQHFDFFPLDSGVFFHKSTVLGSGRLSAALGIHLTPEVPAITPVLSFQLDERTLSWSTWNDVSSSELGIVMDWLADSLFASSVPASPLGPKTHTLVNFILDFIQTTICTPATSPDTRKDFIVRSMEVVSSFIKRFESASILQQTAEPAAVSNSHLASLTGTVAFMSWLLRICRDTIECKVYSFQVEDMLTKVAKVSARALLKRGLEDVRSSYNDLQRPSLRDRGIRRDLQALCSWVVLIKALEHARVPRGGFWDITYWAMYGNSKDRGAAIHTTTDASRLEQLWEGMFTLLPLTEFDSAGMMQAGIRQSMPVDGWDLPKKVLDRVFQVYKSNPHQSPSFNAYCRALVGRCHYLVQEWGWRSCKTVIGTIFDFYGSQDFAHLRNEEVYSSPRFLEELSSGSPSLAIEPEDKCFHIFIKMLGLVILELKRLGLAKEMTNLVARILPNHDRQYLKEMDVHQHDLAALRNHHDLLCTLYWAASSDIRPPIHQIEKLVEPANSHKEACLINIRAWNQLARFVIATNEGYGVYRGFVVWMRNIFNSMLEQYLSAESDMHRQFQNLSKSMMQGIGPEMVKAMAAANQAAAMDVLQVCAVASFDVLQHAKTLGVATYCLSTDQLDSIFTKLDLPSSKCSNWAIFQTALDVLDHYMDRIDAVMDAQYASLNSSMDFGEFGDGTGSSTAVPDPAEADEAVLLLDHSVAKGLFRLINTITHMSWEDLPQSVAAVRVLCTEKSLAIAARLASRFVHAGMYNLSKFFGNGGGSDSYFVFERLPHAPGLVQRKFLPLFVSGLVGHNVFDLKDLGGTNMLEQWLLAIVKPERFLGYENRLARVLQQHNLPYLRRANIPSNVQAAPSYDTNRAYFACAMVSMRQQLREGDDSMGSSGVAGGAAARRQQLRSDFARALRLVMQQIKDDLRFLSRSASTSMASTASTTSTGAHEQYVLFVREIVALMRSHGGDICTLDDFFYSQSVEYAPSPEDPQLRAASIVTYGLRLGEGETTAAPQLFYYLHNSFNIALANGDLAQECRLLERSMDDNSSILKFMLERMLPAILRVSMSSSQGSSAGVVGTVGTVGTACWPLLDVYCSAVEQFLTRSILPKAMDDDVLVGAVASLFEDVVQLLGHAFGGMSSEQEHAAAEVKVRVRTMAQLAALANVLQPLVMVCVCLPACPETTRARLSASIASLYELVEVYGDRRASQGELLSAILNGRSARSTPPAPLAAADRSPQVAQFTASIAKHVKENWVVGDDGSINAKRTQGRAAGASTSAHGHVPFSWSMDELVEELQRQLGLWTLTPAHMRFPEPGSRRRLFPGRERVQRVPRTGLYADLGLLQGI